MINPPHIVKTELQKTACIHITVPRAEIQHVMGPAVAELMAAMTQQGIAPTGPLFSYHLHAPTDVFDFDISFPVASAVVALGRVKAGELAARTVARTRYRGPYEGLGEAWCQFRAWVKENGHTGRC